MNADAPDSLAAVLSKHFLHQSMNSCGPLSPPIDRCQWRPVSGAGSLIEQHRAHVANHLAQAVAADKAEAVRAGRAEALREAADRWEANEGPGYPTALWLRWLAEQGDGE